LGVCETEIETAMIKRLMVTRGEEFTISLKANEAKEGCDALAKEIYAKVCVCLKYTRQHPLNIHFITSTLLHIFLFQGL
jgi:hypothetical protein